MKKLLSCLMALLLAAMPLMATAEGTEGQNMSDEEALAALAGGSRLLHCCTTLHVEDDRILAGGRRRAWMRRSIARASHRVP